jgi:hypothetical protein
MSFAERLPCACATRRITSIVIARSAARPVVDVTAAATVKSMAGQCHASVPQKPPWPWQTTPACSMRERPMP